jgi:hypothetical protein
MSFLYPEPTKQFPPPVGWKRPVTGRLTFMPAPEFCEQVISTCAALCTIGTVGLIEGLALHSFRMTLPLMFGWGMALATMLMWRRKYTVSKWVMLFPKFEGTGAFMACVDAIEAGAQPYIVHMGPQIKGADFLVFETHVNQTKYLLNS